VRRKAVRIKHDEVVRFFVPQLRENILREAVLCITVAGGRYFWNVNVRSHSSRWWVG
jgi:hypothetical protein